jgi:pimeloyl-ACP methyl ester carboxylesterase
MATSSQTFVLIHGYGFESRIWDPVESAFDGYKVIRLSLPGFGNKDISGPYTIELLAKHYWEELTSQGESNVHLIGHSMGGYVCIEMVAQQSDRVASLCLLHSHVFADAEEKKKARTAILEEIESKGREAFVRRMIGSMVFDKEQHAALIAQLIERGLLYDDSAWYNGTLAIRDRKDHAETLRNFDRPCLMIMGEDDTAVPVALAYKQAALIQQAELIIYPQVGHLSMYENTHGLIRDFKKFFTGLSD